MKINFVGVNSALKNCGKAEKMTILFFFHAHFNAKLVNFK